LDLGEGYGGGPRGDFGDVYSGTYGLIRPQNGKPGRKNGKGKLTAVDNKSDE